MELNISYVHNYVLATYYVRAPVQPKTFMYIISMYISLSTVVLNIRDQQGMYEMQYFTHLEAYLTI